MARPMKIKHGVLTDISKAYDRSRPDGLVEVALTVRVRMTFAESKALDDLVDDGEGTIDASVTVGRTR